MTILMLTSGCSFMYSVTMACLPASFTIPHISMETGPLLADADSF